MLHVYDGQCNLGDLPTDYGVGCKEHDYNNAFFGCAENEHDYCTAEFCYVGDECNAPDAAKSSIGAKYRFSYNACGDGIK